VRQVIGGCREGTLAHIVRMTADHTLRQDIFICDRGCKCTWSRGRDCDEPCRHVVAVTTALLVDSRVKGKEP
jgi:hypothetical protein